MTHALAFLIAAFALQASVRGQAVGASTASTVFLVRHAETDNTSPISALSDAGHARADVLADRLRDVRFTHVLASHTTRSRQTVEPVAERLGRQVLQFPKPGSIIAGRVVNDSIPAREAIKPLAEAVLSLPEGSVALVGVNSDNIYAILNQLGVPLGEGSSCLSGVVCVPCLDRSYFPGEEFDRLWVVHLTAGRGVPLMLQIHY